jgi:hypothetical protein
MPSRSLLFGTRRRATGLRPGASPQSRQTARTWSPKLEVLEDRCVPSIVTNLNDSGFGSLRDAIATTPAGGTVDFQPGLTGMITLTSGPLTVAKDLTIRGQGAGVITVSGHEISQVFLIASGSTVTIEDLDITGGLTYGSNGRGGGGIDNAGTLTLTGVTLTANIVRVPVGANDGLGGAIYNTGTLTVTNSTITGNEAMGANSFASDAQAGGGLGGGIYSTGSLTISNTTLSDNQATGGYTISTTLKAGKGEGGGIYSAGPLTLTGDTFARNGVTGGTAPSGNGGEAKGGGVYSAGQLTAVNSTFFNNGAYGDFIPGRGQGQGGGLYLDGGTATLVNDTVASNTVNNAGFTNTGGGLAIGSAVVVLDNTLVAANGIPGTDFFIPADISGAVSPMSSHNLIGAAGTSGLTAGVNGNKVGLDRFPLNPRLGFLASNGGPTQTLALLPGSPAIDAGDNNLAPGPTDQRGQPRIANREIDIGAYESQPPPGFVPIFVDGGAPGRVQVRRVVDGSVLTEFAPYGSDYTASISVAVGDINGDGYPDIVTGAGAGNPHVKVYDGKAIALGTFDPNNPDASLLASFFAYGLGFNIGANVAVGDVNGNGFADIVTGATAGNPDVRVFRGQDIAQGKFDPNGASVVAQWFAYGLSFNIGVNVAVGDVSGDGFDDVVTGATAGNTQVNVYDGSAIARQLFDPNHPDHSLLTSFFIPNTLGQNFGAFVAVGDVNAGGYGDLIVGLSQSPDVYVYDGRAIAGRTFDPNKPTAGQLTHFVAFPTPFPDGVTVGAGDFEADGKADIVTGLTGQSPLLAVIDGLATGIEPPAVNNLRFTATGIQDGLYVNA